VNLKITPSGTLNILHSFCSRAACKDGRNPFAGLVQAVDGTSTVQRTIGGAHGYGTVFKITPRRTFKTLHSFCSQSGCPEGEFPQTGLVQATNGNLYGTTIVGGAYGFGTIFEYPAAGLIQDTNGNLYGITADGGTIGDGTTFSLSVGLGPFVETQPTAAKVGATVNILGTNLTRATSVNFNGKAGNFHCGVEFRNHDLRTRTRHHRRSPGGNAQRHAFEQRVLPGVAIGHRK
jgi:uncharacterized repeat protein (TIGR03803 family)